MPAVRTQGTKLYYIDPAAPSVVVHAGKITAINGIDANRDQIDTTVLEDESRTFMAGLASPGTATFTVQFDPKNTSHIDMHALYKAGTDLKWAVAWSDGTTDPTAAAGVFVPIATRTLLTFDGNIANIGFDFSQNDVVRANVSLQVSGFPTLLPKTAA